MAISPWHGGVGVQAAIWQSISNSQYRPIFLTRAKIYLGPVHVVGKLQELLMAKFPHLVFDSVLGFDVLTEPFPIHSSERKSGLKDWPIKVFKKLINLLKF